MSGATPRSGAGADFFDDMAVAFAGGLRIAKGMTDTGALILRAGEASNEIEFRPWTGFMLTERIVLNRYRRAMR